MKSSAYCYVKTKIWAGFKICISAPLTKCSRLQFRKVQLNRASWQWNTKIWVNTSQGGEGGPAWEAPPTQEKKLCSVIPPPERDHQAPHPRGQYTQTLRTDPPRTTYTDNIPSPPNQSRDSAQNTPRTLATPATLQTYHKFCMQALYIIPELYKNALMHML